MERRNLAIPEFRGNGCIPDFVGNSGDEMRLIWGLCDGRRVIRVWECDGNGGLEWRDLGSFGASLG